MKSIGAACLFVALSLSPAIAGKPAEPRYIGEWSDGRGEVLVVTANKFRVGTHATSFKITSESEDGRHLRMQLAGGVSGLEGRYLTVEVSREEMRMRAYRTLSDCLTDRQVASVISWERDR